MRWRVATGLAILVGATGCGEGKELLPPACGEGPAAVQKALEAAPGEVSVDGSTRLSECLTPDSDGADLQNVGIAFIETAADLAPEAERRPEGRAALELGYLVGAAHRGAGDAAGFHSELLRRLDQEAAPLRGDSAAFRRGERAGRRSG